MDWNILALKIQEKIKTGDIFDYQPDEDLDGIGREIQISDVKGGTALLKWLSETIHELMAIWVGKDLDLGRKMMGLHRKVLLAAAPWDFDSFLQYIEFNREPEKRFYLPRRKTLRKIVQAYQDVNDGKIDLLTVSQPKRTGKTVTGTSFVLFRAGQHPLGSSICSGAGNDLVKSFYNGFLDILAKSDEYLFIDWQHCWRSRGCR